MKKFYLTAAAVTALAAAVFIPPLLRAGNGNSQEFTPGRFAVIAAEVNVMSPRMGGVQNTQNVMVRVDTVTGRTWILQLDTAGGNEPRVRHSAWLEMGTARNR